MATPQSKYTIEVRDGSGNLVQIFDKAIKRRFQLWRNKAGSASFELDVTDPKATWNNLRVGSQDIVFRRFGVPLFAGSLSYVEPLIDRDNRKVTVKATGYFELFKQRFIMPTSTLSFSSVDAGTIAWTLINDTQSLTNGNWGFLQGTIQTSVNRTKTFTTYKNIKDAIQELSEMASGFDFDFSVTIDSSTNVMSKYFNVYYPRKGTDQTALRFEYPGNIKAVHRPLDASSLINEVIERGMGYGSEQTLQDVSATASQAVYKLRQKIDDRPDVTSGTDLTAFANEILRVSQDPADLPEVTVNGNVSPHLGAYNIGDSIKIDVQQAGILNFSNLYRIEGIEVSISEDDDETIVLHLEIA